MNKVASTLRDNIRAAALRAGWLTSFTDDPDNPDNLYIDFERDCPRCIPLPIVVSTELTDGDINACLQDLADTAVTYTIDPRILNAEIDFDGGVTLVEYNILQEMFVNIRESIADLVAELTMSV